MAGPRAVLWDVGGVLVRWDPRNLYKTKFDDRSEMERFLSEVCTMDWHGRHDAGEAMADTAAELAAQHPELAEAIHAWRLRWPDMFDGPIEGSIRLIERLAGAGAPQYALTNYPAEKWPHYRDQSPHIDLLDGVIVSGEVKSKKPSREAFAHVERLSGLSPEDMLFIDDLPANVEAAERYGYHGHVFTSPEAAEAALKHHGLLP